MIKKRFYGWPVIAVKIIESELLDYNDTTGERIYEASIKFEYEFRGNTYVADTPILKGYELSLRSVRENALLKKYKVGDVVNARVCPNAPEICYLEIAKFDWLSATLVPIGLIMYILFFGLWTYFLIGI